MPKNRSGSFPHGGIRPPTSALLAPRIWVVNTTVNLETVSGSKLAVEPYADNWNLFKSTDPAENPDTRPNAWTQVFTGIGETAHGNQFPLDTTVQFFIGRFLSDNGFSPWSPIIFDAEDTTLPAPDLEFNDQTTDVNAAIAATLIPSAPVEWRFFRNDVNEYGNNPQLFAANADQVTPADNTSFSEGIYRGGTTTENLIISAQYRIANRWSLLTTGQTSG